MNEQEILQKVSEYNGPKNGQFFQDVFALAVNNFKYDGYYVEFGAMTGVAHSNTYVLEKFYNWNGLLCEPGKNFKKELMESRSCSKDFRAVFSRSNEILQFKEMKYSTGLSGLEKYNYEDMHANTRKVEPSEVYDVLTVSLNDLLSEHNVPFIIDYMSIDTEGSEPDILESFDFSKHQISFFTIEHNHNKKNKDKIRQILQKNGYQVILEAYSGIDDYFIKVNT